MEPGSLAAIFIAVIGALASWASHRASTKAVLKNTETSNRVEMEKEAYERARKMDVETILRQDSELSELGEKLVARDARIAEQEQEIIKLKSRVRRLEEHVEKLEGKNG